MRLLSSAFPISNGMYIKVKVKAGAKSEEVFQESADHFKISVREPAKRNMANRRVIELVAMQFKVSPKNVRIISGHHSPGKLLAVETSVKK